MMRWLQPEMAVWLLALPVAVLGWGLRFAVRRRHRKVWPLAGVAQRRSGSLRDLSLLALAVLVLVALAAAVARPQVRSERITPTYEKQDLVLILDQSVSMHARDIEPSRFVRAVEEIEAFIETKPATLDRIALVGFSGTSVILSYPTSDLGALSFYLDWIRDDHRPLFGTDMSSALETALAVARRDGETRLRPIFVLVSDGEDHAAGLDGTIRRIAREGIRVYTIGVGSSHNVTIPVRNDQGNQELLRDDDGRLVRTRFQEGTLRRLAALTGGQYFRSTSGAELSRALHEILDDARQATGTVSTIEYRELYPLLLAIAAGALIGMVTVW